MVNFATIVVPCYNEEKRLDVDAFISFVAETGEFRFIFVDDGSSDGTMRVLDEMTQRSPKSFSVLKLPANRGKAEAVRLGVLEAQKSDSTSIGFFDADLATPLRELIRLKELLELEEGCDIVMGSRIKLLGRKIERKWYRHYAGRVFATVTSIVLKLAVYDTQCGAKLFRRSTEMDRLWAEPFMSKWIFDVELLARYQKMRKSDSVGHKERIYEMPLKQWCEVGGSKIKASDFLVSIKELAKIYWVYR